MECKAIDRHSPRSERTTPSRKKRVPPLLRKEGSFWKYYHPVSEALTPLLRKEGSFFKQKKAASREAAFSFVECRRTTPSSHHLVTRSGCHSSSGRRRANAATPPRNKRGAGGSDVANVVRAKEI